MLKITSKEFNVTDAIRNRIESRLEKLNRHDVDLINPHIIIITDGPMFKIESSIKVNNGQLFAQAKHQNLYTAINAMGQKLEKQLNRLTHKPTKRTAPVVAEVPDEYDEEYAA